jgi:hypothetical protein
VVSEMSACRMRLIIALFHAPVLSCWYVVAVERALVQASVAICVRRVVVRGCFRGGNVSELLEDRCVFVCRSCLRL